ncbi:MAG: helix-turn-helix domain-containing protein [Deltaproteobacteria bacterium]|nr:helix-turn-helix domain-containing protein [Deltaproteobacteria bacterium]
MQERLLDIDDLAERLKVNKSWIYAQTRKKNEDAIPHIKLGKYLRFEEGRVKSWYRRKFGRGEVDRIVPEVIGE